MFFFAITQMKIYIEDQFLGEGNVGKKNTILLKQCIYVSNKYKLCRQFRNQ